VHLHWLTTPCLVVSLGAGIQVFVHGSTHIRRWEICFSSTNENSAGNSVGFGSINMSWFACSVSVLAAGKEPVAGVFIL
jgi:hypothetical protein